ncbi:MAG TPA: response regulator transcription factor [Gammaproteobacteria bacterium]|jgi:DNA-binding NarL/FixJ family response regulator|nr:response regulator transcription factor [Gammaproteobacteria bacterium]
MQNMKKLRISVIDDCDMHKLWLESILANDLYAELVSADDTGRAGIQSVKVKQPSLVLLDFRLADLTGIEVAKRIKAYDATIKIFMLTAYTKPSIIDRIFSNSHIDGLAIKGSYYFELNLPYAIKQILAGSHYLDPSLLRQLRQLKNEDDFGKLTQREFEVYAQLNMGKSDLKIASDLCVEVAHVKNMKSRIIKKIKNENIYSLL